MTKPFIICVDDERSVLDTVTRDLASNYGDKFTIEACQSAAEADQLRSEILSNGQKVAIYIVDQRMPEKEGVEFLKGVEKGPGKILLTAYADPKAAIEGINFGCIDRYVHKTDISTELFKSIDALLAKSAAESKAAETAKLSRTLVPLDTSWFDEKMDFYMNTDSFRLFSELAKVDLRDLIFTGDWSKVATAQQKIVGQSKVFNEIQGEHAGYTMPLIYYTHDLGLFADIPNHNIELEKMILSFDQGDSLRRRHIALSHSVLPNAIRQLANYFGRPITIKNFGSGIGLDAVNALMHCPDEIERIINVDINQSALDTGNDLVKYLVSEGKVPAGKVVYRNENFLSSGQDGPIHMGLSVGTFCGLTDPAAGTIIKRGVKGIEAGGYLIVTCGNIYMRDTDPIANFVIQHIGTRKDPSNGWGLNFRTRESLYNLLDKAGLSMITIHDDANYPGMDAIQKDILYGVDPTPTLASGRKPLDSPLALPYPEVLNRSIGYNWIGIGKK